MGESFRNVVDLDKYGKVYCYDVTNGESIVPYDLGKTVKVLCGVDFYALCENGRVYNWTDDRRFKVRLNLSQWRDIKDIDVYRGSIIGLDRNGNVFIASDNKDICNIPKDLKDIVAVSVGGYRYCTRQVW